MHRWHELLVLTTCAYQAIHGYSTNSSPGHINNLNELVNAEFPEQVIITILSISYNNLCFLNISVSTLYAHDLMS